MRLSNIDEEPEMNIMIKLFLLIYLLIIALVTILSVIWILTSVFKFERVVKNSLSNNSHK
ncbi:MAG: hypothetical protein DRQ44_13150 [Gammaproteobacteria bacterium]|nr:MAG: hypothetical protein DRQ44_13150 [Gammaproteobacteria bacterium]